MSPPEISTAPRANHPHAPSRNPEKSRHDHRHGDPRASAGGTLRRSPRGYGRRQASFERSRAMKPRDLGDLAFRNLREALLRNSLTTLGIAVGVASLVAMLSLGVGLQQLAAKRLSNSGLFDTVLVTSRRNLRDFNRPSADKSAPPQ